jgi:hypothetical protein
LDLNKEEGQHQSNKLFEVLNGSVRRQFIRWSA